MDIFSFNLVYVYSTNTHLERYIMSISQNSWPSRALKKNSVGIFEYILASMLKVYLDVF